MNKYRVIALLFMLAGLSIAYPVSQDFIEHRAASAARQTRSVVNDAMDGSIIGSYLLNSSSSIDAPASPSPPALDLRWERNIIPSLVSRDAFDMRRDLALINLDNTHSLSDSALAALARAVSITRFTDSQSEWDFVKTLTHVVLSRISEVEVISVSLADAYLCLWDFWQGVYMSEAEWLRLYAPKVWLSLMHHSFAPKSCFHDLEWTSPAYLAAILQRASIIDCYFLQDTDRRAFTIAADFHIQTLIDAADFTMGIPLWVDSGVIFLESHVAHIYGFMRYKQYSGKVEMPATLRQIQSSLAVFELPRLATNEPNIYYASGFWVYSDAYEDERQMATMPEVVRFAVVGRTLPSSLFWINPTQTLLQSFQSDNGLLLRPGGTLDANQAELNAWMLYAYANYLR